MAKDILPTLLQGKKVIRGMLGVAVQDVTPALAKEFGLSESKGALISQVNSGSPAEKAGIKTGDVAVKFNGKPVDDSRHFRQMVARIAPGTPAEITVVRKGKEKTMPLTIGELQSQKAKTSAHEAE